MSNVSMPNHLKNLSDAILRRQDLVLERNRLRSRISSGADFFAQQMDGPKAKDLCNGAKTMLAVVNELQAIDKEIFELDTITISKLEQELIDSIVRIRTNETVNEAGDNVPAEDFYCIPSCYAKDDMVTVDADDLLFLKIIKAALSVHGVEVLSKKPQE